MKEIPEVVDIEEVCCLRIDSGFGGVVLASEFGAEEDKHAQTDKDAENKCGD